MKVAIAGAGAVGRSIARALVDHHEVTLLERNPEGAAPRGKWADREFLSQVSEMNDKLTDTQFADYHGHGWNFRAVFKRDRKGNLLDADTLDRYVDILLGTLDEKKETNQYLKEILQGAK